MYYRGDYYRGDYYRGGFLSNAFRAVTGTLGGAVKGLFTGGVPGAIVGAARGAGSAARRNLTAETLAVQPNPLAFTGGPQPHYVPGVGVVSQRGAHHVYGKVVGGKTMKMIAGPAGPMLLPGRSYRRMNPTNVRALRRAGRRVKGFLKLAARLGALPIAHHGKKLFKRKRRK